MKKLIFGFAAFALAGLAFAQDFGIDLDGAAAFDANSKQTYSARHKAALWVKLPIGSAFRFDAKGNITWNGSATDLALPMDAYLNGMLGAYLPPKASFKWDFDLVKFGFALVKPQEDLPSMGFTFGRYPFADLTRYVWSGKADGAGFSFNYGATALSIGGAYTGLLFKDSTTIALTPADIAANKLDSATAPFTSPRALFQVELAFPNVFNHSLAFGAFAQEDMGSDASFISEGTTVYNPDKGGYLDTQYLEAKASGPIVDSLFYELSGAFGTGRTLRWLADSASDSGYSYKYVPIYSGLGSLSLSWYSNILPGSMLSFRALYASGDAGTDQTVSNAFVPVSSTSLGLVFSPQLSNLACGDLTLSAQPFEGTRIQTVLKALTFFRPTLGAISESGIKAGSTAYYLGSEVDFFLIYRILSDVGISFTLGAFVPGIDPAGAFDKSYASSLGFNYSAGLAVSISM
jgi:hypothetical protein